MNCIPVVNHVINFKKECKKRHTSTSVSFRGKFYGSMGLYGKIGLNYFSQREALCIFCEVKHIHVQDDFLLGSIDTNGFK